MCVEIFFCIISARLGRHFIAGCSEKVRNYHRGWLLGKLLWWFLRAVLSLFTEHGRNGPGRSCQSGFLTTIFSLAVSNYPLRLPSSLQTRQRDRQTDRQTGRQTNLQPDRQTDRQMLNMCSTCVQHVFNMCPTYVDTCVFNICSTCVQHVFNICSTCVQHVST